MKLLPEHLAILAHTNNGAPQGFYCGDSPTMQELVADGLMMYAGKKSFVPDPYFSLTEKGRETLRSSRYKQ